MATTGWLSRKPGEFRREVLRRSLYRQHAAGRVLYDIDDEPGGVFGLVQGSLEVQLANGHIGTIGAPGFWLGEATAFRRERRKIALVAKTPVSVFYLPLHEFEHLIANPEYCRSFAILTIEHLEDALRVAASPMPNDVVARVSGRLLSLAMATHPVGCDLSVTQSDLASMCGLTRQTVSKALRRPMDEGAISCRYGKTTVIDADNLRRFAAASKGAGISYG